MNKLKNEIKTKIENIEASSVDITKPMRLSNSANTDEQRITALDDIFKQNCEYLRADQIYFYFDEEYGYRLDTDSINDDIREDIRIIEEIFDEMNHEWLACQEIDNREPEDG